MDGPRGRGTIGQAQDPVPLSSLATPRRRLAGVSAQRFPGGRWRGQPALATLVASLEAQHAGRAVRLHDQVLQHLYSLRLSAPRDETGALQEHLDQMAEQVQALVREMQPPCLQSYGLVEALRSLELPAPGFRLHLAFRDVAETPQPADLCVLRIVQEGLANVAAHAGVQEATVSLHQQGAALTFRVSDEGRGFDGKLDLRRWNADGRFGLTRALLYARAAGGRLTLRSAPGAGTLLSVRLPTFGPSLPL